MTNPLKTSNLIDIDLGKCYGYTLISLAKNRGGTNVGRKAELSAMELKTLIVTAKKSNNLGIFHLYRTEWEYSLSPVLLEQCPKGEL